MDDRSRHTPQTTDAGHSAELLDLGDAFFELDREWRVVRVNRNQERLSQKPREETLGRVFWEVWPETADPQGAYWREYHRCMDERVSVQFEAFFEPLHLWTAVTAYPVSSGGIAAFFRDVTLRKRAEQALRAERDFGDAVLDTLAALVVVLDPEGRIVRLNRACERMTGYAASEAIGKSVFELLVPEPDRDGARAVFARLRVGDFPIQHRNRWRSKDGTERMIAWSNAAIPDVRGAVEYVIGTGLDVTDRERAVEALRESEARFRSVFEQAAIGMGRVRFSDARWIDVNDAFCRMLGRSREEMLATPWPEMTHPEDLELDLAPFRRMAAGELDSYTVEKRFVHASGRHVWAKLTLSLVRDGGGEPDYEVAIVEDIGDRKGAEEELRASEERLRLANDRLQEADRRKDEFLGMLSHELRNPLAPIRNALWILDHARPGGQQAQRAKDIVARQVAHLTRLVDDLLDVTRVARGKIQLRREEVDLAALVRRTAEDYRPLMQDRGLDLAVQVPARPVAVNGDAARLTQIFGNLLNNAAKFTPAGGRVALSMATEGGRAVAHVRDTGSGITPDVLPFIFDPFTQGEQTLARSEGGLGLGLSLVKGLVALHDGEVTATSAGPGRGTDFVVSLPLAAERGRDAAPAAGNGATEAARAPKRVLVIDDNRDAADTLAELIALMGHAPEVAYDAPSGLAKAQADLPDVVLCDIGLPGMDGYEFARRFHPVAAEHGVRLVAVSGYAQPEDVARSAEAGFDAHVAKPPDPDRLASLLG